MASRRPAEKLKLSIRIPQHDEEHVDDDDDDDGRQQHCGATDVIALLVLFRFVNALCVSTFFQPDEYFQALEPAWQIAFGRQSGAWITWEWRHQLRSSLHPLVFAVFYNVSDKIMALLSASPHSRALAFVALPKILQSLFAAAGDYYTWKFAEHVYKRGSAIAFTALLLNLLSPWQWFCSTRTFSNSIETVFTVIALNFWPWALYGDVDSGATASTDSTASFRKPYASPAIFKTPLDISRLRVCLAFAGAACILRPTNIFIWISLVTIAVTRFGLFGPPSASPVDFLYLLREVVLCGSTAVIFVSAVSDRFYFGMWTFPPYQWLNFNITQSLAVFYGTNRWDYYLTEGLPLLLTTSLPFALLALWSSSSTFATLLPAFVANVRFQLAFTIVTLIAILSGISHKEVRFIYPLLPSLHILTAPHILSFFNATPLVTTIKNSSDRAVITIDSWRRHLLVASILTNLCISIYVTQFHQRGVIDVLALLRRDYEKFLPVDHRTRPKLASPDQNETFVGFLMPCHSTPWRSHLVYPTLRAWALTCEPPLNMPAGTEARASYRDEADRFYDAPDTFLRTEVGAESRPWPRYIVGFEGIEGPLGQHVAAAMPGTGIRRKWDLFNSHWHDDWRRAGRIVVWEFVWTEEGLGHNTAVSSDP